MNNPLISIVLPSYNGGRYIRSAIDSIVSQTYTNWELILVDDGSTDDAPKIMEEYSKKYPNIFYYQNEVNRGLAATLNIGFSKAKGPYYTWISDDNLFKNNALEVLLKNIDDSDVVYSDYDSIDELGKFIQANNVGNIKKIIFNYVVGPCFLYKKQCHEAVGGYDESYKSCEDYDFFLKIYHKGFKFRAISNNLFLFRNHGAAMSSNSKLLILNTEKAVIQNAINNAAKISRTDLSKIYIDRFKKNIYQFKWNFLAKSFYYNPFYALTKIIIMLPKILLRII